MLKRAFRWLWYHRKLSLTLFLLLSCTLVNFIAYMHARAMTHFTTSGERTKNPEDLSVWRKMQVLCSGINIPRPANAVTPASQGLAFEVHRFNARDGRILEAWHLPSPAVKGLVALFHGYSASKASLLREAKAFHDLGYATFLVDFRGSGGSDGNETTIGVEEADDVVSTWEYLREQWPGQPVVLFGQSMGSAAILRAVALLGIQPAALVIECPFDKLLSTVENRFDSMGLPSFPMARLLVFWGGVQHGFNGFNHNPVDYASRVRCPVLLFHGENDVRVTHAQAHAIFDRLAGVKQLAVFDHLGHASYVTSDPETWARWVNPFLARWTKP